MKALLIDGVGRRRQLDIPDGSTTLRLKVPIRKTGLRACTILGPDSFDKHHAEFHLSPDTIDGLPVYRWVKTA